MTVEEDQLDFVGKRHRRAGSARRLGAVVAPVASHGGAVVDDPSMLRFAEAVIGAFGQGDIDQGLTRAQITERVLRVEDLDRAPHGQHRSPEMVSADGARNRRSIWSVSHDITTL